MRIPRTLLARVSNIEDLTDRVKRFTLIPVDKDEFSAFHPGAHIETVIQTTTGALKRQYSLCGNPEENRYYQIAIKRAESSRRGSQYWHDEVRVGQNIEISSPINHFSLSFYAKHHILVAGGIGITPFLPMMWQLQSRGESFELHYAARSQNDCAFYDEIRGNYGKRVHFYFSDCGSRLETDLLHDRKVGTHVYLCGPHTLMKEFRHTAKKLGFPRSNVHLEAFSAPNGEHNVPFQIHLQKSQRDVTVGSDKTALEALLDAGIDVPFSCQAGGCGTCLLDVVAGEVEHRDFYLTEEEQLQQRHIVSCVSRAKGTELVINL